MQSENYGTDSRTHLLSFENRYISRTHYTPNIFPCHKRIFKTFIKFCKNSVYKIAIFYILLFLYMYKRETRRKEGWLKFLFVTPQISTKKLPKNFRASKQNPKPKLTEIWILCCRNVILSERQSSGTTSSRSRRRSEKGSAADSRTKKMFRTHRLHRWGSKFLQQFIQNTRIKREYQKSHNKG